jgi:hypothetical protein
VLASDVTAMNAFSLVKMLHYIEIIVFFPQRRGKNIWLKKMGKYVKMYCLIFFFKGDQLTRICCVFFLLKNHRIDERSDLKDISLDHRSFNRLPVIKIMR